MSELKGLGKCPYTSTGLWWGITEKKHNVLDHLPISEEMEIQLEMKRNHEQLKRFNEDFRKEHKTDFEAMKNIQNELY